MENLGRLEFFSFSPLFCFCPAVYHSKVKSSSLIDFQRQNTTQASIHEFNRLYLYFFFKLKKNLSNEISHSHLLSMCIYLLCPYFCINVYHKMYSNSNIFYVCNVFNIYVLYLKHLYSGILMYFSFYFWYFSQNFSF